MGDRRDLHFEELDEVNQHEARALILQGLGEHWGEVDESLNPELDNMVASYGHGRTVLVRSDEGQVVGTGTLLPRPNNRAEVLRMSVASEFRREGIGASIIAELMDTARRWSAEYVVLETTSSWRAAVEFYLNCGFTITHIEEARFGSGTWFEMPLSAD